MVDAGQLAIGDKSPDGQVECMDVHVTSRKTARVTVRTTGLNEQAMWSLARKAVPTGGIQPHAKLYTQFTSNGYLYATYMVSWS